METVLITGCSSGIGRATARAFLGQGWRVYATARDPADVVDLDERGCVTASLDVTDDEAVERVVDRTIEEAGRIDCLVNNAGYAQLGPLEDLPVADVRRQFDVNVHGPHRLTRAVLPHMREQGDGTIVTLSSVVGRVSFPGGGAYSGSKHAVEAMSDALRGEVADLGIDVVVVQPGPVESSFRDRAARELETGIDRSPVYETLYSVLEDTRIVGGGGPFASEPRAVAAVILNAASCQDPAPRYPVGPVAKAALYLRFVPDRWRDRAVGLARRLVG